MLFRSKNGLKGADLLHAGHSFHFLFYMAPSWGCGGNAAPGEQGGYASAPPPRSEALIFTALAPRCVLMLNTLNALTGKCTANKRISCPWVGLHTHTHTHLCSQSVNTVVLPVLISGENVICIATWPSSSGPCGSPHFFLRLSQSGLCIVSVMKNSDINSVDQTVKNKRTNFWLIAVVELNAPSSHNG